MSVKRVTSKQISKTEGGKPELQDNQLKEVRDRSEEVFKPRLKVEKGQTQEP